MYSTLVIEHNQAKIEAKLKLKLKRWPIDEAIARADKINRLRKPDGVLLRDLEPEEREFIRNERLLTQIDFFYWFDRYHKGIKDGTEGGGLGTFDLWESQRMLLNLIAEIQEEQFERKKRGEKCAGIRIADHKCRQVGHTEICSALKIHRLTNQNHHRAFCASVDEQKIGELYESRDKTIYNNLPWFIRPAITYDEKNDHIQFSTHSRVVYMIYSQKYSMGQGQQFDFAHLTECSECAAGEAQIELDLFPAFALNPNLLVVLESRANGRGNWWHSFSEQVRKNQVPFWRYCFTPWYVEPRKYSYTAPVDWNPDENTLKHANMVYESSPRFLKGHHCVLSRDQMYWWEMTRSGYQKSGTLNLFLTNYCATPEESFQHNTVSAFGYELLEQFRLEVGSEDPRYAKGRPYELRIGDQNSQGLHVPNCGTLVPLDRSDLDQDSRGVVWFFEPPRDSALYYLGCDATQGITGWDRLLRTENDSRTDNGVISVIRHTRDMDYQVAEYAAPIDPEDLAHYVNALGRTFSGFNDDGQAESIIEVYPGPGGITQKMLIHKYGYTNLWIPRYVNTLAPEGPRNVVGWRSNQQTRRDLWLRGGGHIRKRKIRLYSPWLVEELTDCQADDWMLTETARARFGKHDDRVIAILLAIYAANDWSMEVETEKVEVRDTDKPDWQCSDCDVDELNEGMEQRWSEITS